MITKNKISISYKNNRYANVGLSYSSTKLINLNIIEDKN